MNGRNRMQTLKEKKRMFDPSYLVSNDEFNTNLNAIIAYYQMTRGEVRQRFVSSR